MFNAEKEAIRIINWIKDYAEKTNMKGAIFGCSGGKDSTIVAALLERALGKDKVLAVLMPNGVQKDIDDSLRVVKHLNLNYTIFNIGTAYDAFVKEGKDEIIGNLNIGFTEEALINVAPRFRMTTLYTIGQSIGFRVCGTGNASEIFIGYCTKWGDAASDFNPIANYTSEEVIAIGDYLDLPYDLVHKTPSDGLCGKSDEDRLGFTYKDLNKYINDDYKDLTVELVEKFYKLHLQCQHKFEKIPTCPREE